MTRLQVDTPDAFRFRATLLSHGWIDLAPFGFDEDYTVLHRTQRLQGGRVVRFTVGGHPSGSLTIDVHEQDLSGEEVEEIRAAVRQIFHLDLDLDGFYERLKAEERYAWVAKHGAGRLLRSPTLWEDLAKTLLTTNTTWAMTRAMVKRLTGLGDATADGRHAFPLPEQVAALSPEELDARVRAGYRSQYLHELARKISEGEIDIDSWAGKDLSADDLYRQITALKGFGPYAAGAVLKLLGKFDRLALDSAARTMFAREFAEGERALDSTIAEHYDAFGEWRGLVLWMDLMGPYFLARAE